jgi:RIO-like serine/threonine protein kinase
MLIGGFLIGSGRQSCVVSNPDNDNQVIKVYRGSIDELEEEMTIARFLRKIDPEERRFVASHGFRYYTLEELERELPHVYKDFMDCNEEQWIYEPMPEGVVVSYMTRLSEAPERFSPAEKAHLEESIRILNKDAIHGDIHPRNIMMHGRDPVFIDWGLSKMHEGDEMSALEDAYETMRQTQEKNARKSSKRSRSMFE